jgi:hypothetical protein
MGIRDRFMQELFKAGQRIGALPPKQAALPVAPAPLSPRPAPAAPALDPFVGADPWLSGGQPLTPKDPAGTPPRRFQYAPGYNIQISPRSTEAISFAQLRALSEYTMVRVIIEHVKEALKSHEWDVVPDDPEDGANHEADIATALKFLERPDGQHEWDEWLGMVIEEVLVVDALTLYKHRTFGGQLHSLEVIDGATIKVLTDVRGFTPEPPTPAYQQFLYGVPKTWYTKDEMIYAPRNRRANKFYGFSPTEQIVLTINEGMRRDFYNLAQFTDGTTPAGLATLPKEWKLEEIRAWDQYVEDILAGNAQRRSKILWSPEGTQLHKFRDEETFGLFNKFDEWLARICCFAYGVSPMPFISMTNRAVAQEMGDIEAEGGVASLKLFIERLINRVIDDDLAMPHLRFNWVTDRARLQAKRVSKNVEYAKIGALQIDEIRAEEGKKPFGLPPGMITAMGYTPFQITQPTIPVGNQTIPTEDAAVLPARPELADGSRPVVSAASAAALRKCRADELDKWERWAENRLAKGAGLTGFKPEFLDHKEAAAVEAELSKGGHRTTDRLKHLFATRKARVNALRLEPPNPGDAASRSGDLKAALTEVLTREAERIIGKE